MDKKVDQMFIEIEDILAGKYTVARKEIKSMLY